MAARSSAAPRSSSSSAATRRPSGTSRRPTRCGPRPPPRPPARCAPQRPRFPGLALLPSPHSLTPPHRRLPPALSQAGDLVEGGSTALARLRKASADVPRGLGGVAGLGKGLPKKGARGAAGPLAASPSRAERSPATLPRRQTLTTLTVKATLGTTTKTLSVPITASYTDLLAAVQAAFPGVQPLALKFRDQEDDLVTINSKSDMRQAVTLAIQRQVRRKAAKALPGFRLRWSPVGVWFLTRCLPLPCPPPRQQQETNAGPHGPSLPISSLPPLRLECVEVERSPEAPLDERPKNAPPIDEVIEIDEWLLDFADAFKARLGLKEGDAVDMREIGLDKCCEVLDQLVAAPEAKPLMAAAAAKFRESASSAELNWGNVHTSLARKILESGQTDILRKTVEAAQAAEPDAKMPTISPLAAHEQAGLDHFDALEEEYRKAAQHFAKALEIKGDNFEAAYTWAQQAFDRAKLVAHRAEKQAKKCSAADADRAFAEAVEKYKLTIAITEQQEKADKAAAKEAGEKEEEPEPGAYTNRQHMVILLGNVLIEQSNVKHARGDASWRADADEAVRLYRSVPCPEEDIERLLERHPSGAWVKGEDGKLAAAAPQEGKGGDAGGKGKGGGGKKK